MSRTLVILEKAWSDLSPAEQREMDVHHFYINARIAWGKYFDDLVMDWWALYRCRCGEDWLIANLEKIWQRMKGTCIQRWGAPGSESFDPPYTQLEPADREMLASEVAYCLATLRRLRLEPRVPMPTEVDAAEFLDRNQTRQLALF